MRAQGQTHQDTGTIAAAHKQQHHQAHSRAHSRAHSCVQGPHRQERGVNTGVGGGSPASTILSPAEETQTDGQKDRATESRPGTCYWGLACPSQPALMAPRRTTVSAGGELARGWGSGQRRGWKGMDLPSALGSLIRVLAKCPRVRREELLQASMLAEHQGIRAPQHEVPEAAALCGHDGGERGDPRLQK